MRAEIEQAQLVYTENKKRFFGLCFSDENLTIQVLENVQDFMEEGDTLRHCLFTNEFYKKKDSLVFSARYENSPVETIELSLTKMEIIQCRGFQNKRSKHHKKILELMKKNVYKISARMKKKEVKTI